MDNKITIYCDGGSRGNPGPAALGVVIENGVENSKEYSEFLGKATNNEAEYRSAVYALKKTKQLTGGKEAEKTEIEIRMDSELVVRQLSGEYKLKEEKLIPFFVEIWNLKQDFKKVKFIHIPREKNKKADYLVNKELDAQTSNLNL